MSSEEKKKIDAGLFSHLEMVITKKQNENWNAPPPPPPDNPVRFSRQISAGLVIWLWESTLLMLSSFFSHPPPPPPLSVAPRAVWLCLRGPGPPFSLPASSTTHQPNTEQSQGKKIGIYLPTYSGTSRSPQFLLSGNHLPSIPELN